MENGDEEVEWHVRSTLHLIVRDMGNSKGFAPTNWLTQRAPDPLPTFRLSIPTRRFFHRRRHMGDFDSH